MGELKACQMPTDEVIKILERISHTESKWPGTEDSLMALDMAVNALRRAATENKAMTCDGCRYNDPAGDAPQPEAYYECKRQSRQDLYARKPE